MESKFTPISGLGDTITALGGYHVTVGEQENIVMVKVYDSTDKSVYSTTWELRD